MAIAPLPGWEVDPNNTNAVRKIGSAQPTPSPTITAPVGDSYASVGDANAARDPVTGELKSSAPTSVASPSEYYPRYTSAEQGATDYLSTFQAPKSVDQIRTEKTTAAQARIDAMNKYYDSLTAEQRGVNEGRTRGTNAVSILSGLAGSSEAELANTKTGELNARDIGKIQAERAVAINDILFDIENSSIEEAKQSRLEARQSAQDILAARTARQTQAGEQLKMLASSGVTLDGLKKTDPQSFEYFTRNVGSEELVKAMFTLNRPKEDVVSSQVLNGKYVVAYKNPLTNKISIDTVDLNLPDGYSKGPVDAGDRLIFAPDNWDGDVSKLVAINKGLTPAQTEKSNPAGASMDSFPPDIQAAAQSILDGKSKLNEYPSAKRLQINAAMSKVYNAEGGNELAQGAYDSAVTLSNHPGFGGAVGTNLLLGYGKEISGTQSAGFIAELNKLKANLKLVNIKYLKGTGALSDAEGKTLENASTSLDPSLPEVDFRNELQRVTTALAKAKGVKTVDDGTGTPEIDIAAKAPVGSTVTINGVQYKKTGDDAYEPI